MGLTSSAIVKIYGKDYQENPKNSRENIQEQMDSNNSHKSKSLNILKVEDLNVHSQDYG